MIMTQSVVLTYDDDPACKETDVGIVAVALFAGGVRTQEDLTRRQRPLRNGAHPPPQLRARFTEDLKLTDSNCILSL